MNKKEILTIEKIKKRNSAFGCVLWLAIPSCLLFAIVGLGMVFGLKEEMSGPFILFPAIFVLTPILFIIFLLSRMKKEKKENNIIDSGDFKIVEDKIYDKYMYVSRDSDGDRHYHHYIFSKTYGKISTDALTYRDAQKDDSVYLLFYNNNEQNNRYNNAKEEEKRNRNTIDQKFLATQYELSPEFLNKFVPYNESLGEANFNSRTNDLINTLEAKESKVICKRCGEKYSLKKFDTCPNCNSLYKFDITDIIHEKEWY